MHHSHEKAPPRAKKKNCGFQENYEEKKKKKKKKKSKKLKCAFWWAESRCWLRGRLCLFLCLWRLTRLHSRPAQLNSAQPDSPWLLTIIHPPTHQPASGHISPNVWCRGFPERQQPPIQAHKDGRSVFFFRRRLSCSTRAPSGRPQGEPLPLPPACRGTFHQRRRALRR